METHKFEVALASTNGGQMVSFDTNGAVVGTIQMLTASSGSPFAGPYVFELEGGDIGSGSNSGSAYIGSISFNSDLTVSGTGLAGASYSGTYEIPDENPGRGTATITMSPGTKSNYPPVTFDLVFYRQNVSQLILIGTDTVQYQGQPPANELHSGLAFPQTVPISSFPPSMTFMQWGVSRMGILGAFLVQVEPLSTIAATLQTHGSRKIHQFRERIPPLPKV